MAQRAGAVHMHEGKPREQDSRACMNSAKQPLTAAHALICPRMKDFPAELVFLFCPYKKCIELQLQHCCVLLYEHNSLVF